MVTDFIADGIKRSKTGKGRILIYTLTYLPPLIIVLIAPGIFIKALSYAGIWCILLLIVLPIGMLYAGRYHHAIAGITILPLKKHGVTICLAAALILLLAQFSYLL